MKMKVKALRVPQTTLSRPVAVSFSTDSLVCRQQPGVMDADAVTEEDGSIEH